MIIRLHHIGMEVENLDKAEIDFKNLGFQKFMRFRTNDMSAEAVFLVKETAEVELWEFKDKNSALAQMVRKHSAFESSSLEGDLEAFLAFGGYEMVIPKLR